METPGRPRLAGDERRQWVMHLRQRSLYWRLGVLLRPERTQGVKEAHPKSQRQEQAGGSILGQQPLLWWPGWAPQGLAPDAPTRQEEKQSEEERCWLVGPRVATREEDPPCPGWAPQGLAPAARVGKRWKLKVVVVTGEVECVVMAESAVPPSGAECLQEAAV